MSSTKTVREDVVTPQGSEVMGGAPEGERLVGRSRTRMGSTLLAGAAALALGSQGCAPYSASGYARFGIQGISTTTNTSETADTGQISFNLPKSAALPDEIDAPSVQTTVALTGYRNGFDFQAQVSQGVTLTPSRFLTTNVGAALGVDTYCTGLDNKDTKSCIAAPYVLPSMSLNLALPISASKLVISPFATAKTYLTDVRFKGEDDDRSRLQFAPGLNLAYTREIGGVPVELGTNAAWYPTDKSARKGAIPVWGEALYAKFPF